MLMRLCFKILLERVHDQLDSLLVGLRVHYRLAKMQVNSVVLDIVQLLEAFLAGWAAVDLSRFTFKIPPFSA